MTDTLARARTWLAQVRNPDGTWGYLPGHEGRPEPTLLTTAAGFESPISWLSRRDLGWPHHLLPLLLAERPEARDLVQRTLAALETEQAETVSAPLDFDTTIPAWGWVSGTAAWVEPTSQAVLSLRRAGRAESPRVAAGQRMLLDRQGQDGGWNYGNPTMLGAELESYPETTAWALLALQGSTGRGGEKSRDGSVEKAFAFLDRWADRPTTLSAALHAHALDAWGRDPEDAQASLVRLQEDDGSWRGRVDLTALAASALALLEGRHAFRV